MEFYSSLNKKYNKTNEEYFKIHKDLVYSTHDIVNHDFKLYIRYISNRMYISVLNLFNYILSGNKAFYLKKDITEFCNLVKSFNIIRKFTQKLYQKQVRREAKLKRNFMHKRV